MKKMFGDEKNDPGEYIYALQLKLLFDTSGPC